jgi:DNA-binding transcriptional LysR family regulator
MDFRSLEAFCLVVRLGTLAKAASQMGISPAAISLQIKNLEAELGFKLFHHHPNKLLLTTQGEGFLKVASSVLGELERAKEITLRAQQKSSQRIAIALRNDCANFFSPAIASFVKGHPTLATTILVRPTESCLALVMKGEVDLGLGRFGGVPKGIHKEELMESSLMAVFSRSHQLSKKVKIDLRDLAAHRLITPASGTAARRTIDMAFFSGGVEPQDIIEVSDCRMTAEYARLGLGAGLVHNNCMSAELKKVVRCVDLSGLFEKDRISLIYRQAALFGPIHQALINTLVQYARKKG